MDIKETYISQWQNNFNRFFNWAWNYANCVLNNSNASDADKKCFTSVINTLLGKDVTNIKHDLETGGVTLETFDKIEKFYNDLLDAAIDSINESKEAKQFIKGVSREMVAIAKSFGIQEARRAEVIED